MDLGSPVLKNKSFFLNYIIIWVIVIVAHTVIISYFYGEGILVSLSDSLLFNVLFSIIGVYVWFPAKFIKTETGKRFVVLFNHILIALIITGVWLTVGYSIMSMAFSENTSYVQFLQVSLPWRFFLGIFFYAGTAMFYYVMIFHNSLQEKIYREVELKGMVREAEMNMLKFQLNPHFIFNSLNSISSLTLTSPEKAREMIIKLSDFLRYSLQQGGVQKSTLKNELNNIENYLAIEKIRFGDKLEFTKEMEVDCSSHSIPSLILQPVIENAIKHGVYQSTEKVGIQFSCKKDNGFIVIEVHNNYDPDSVLKKGAGIGLKNVAERLKLIYDKGNLLEVSQEKDSFTVRIFIPFDNE